MILNKDDRIIMVSQEHGRHPGIVVLVSPNQESVYIGLDEAIGLWSKEGGLLVTPGLPLSRTHTGYQDLFGNDWSIEVKT